MRKLSVAALAGALVLALAVPAGASGPPTTVPRAAPTGYVLIGRHVDRVAASNQGTLVAEAGVQLHDGASALWLKVYADHREVGARFSDLSIQELGTNVGGRRHAVASYRRAGPVGPTHATAGHGTVYYLGRFRPINPATRSWRVCVSVSAWKAGTFLVTSQPKRVCSFEVDLRGRVIAPPLA